MIDLSQLEPLRQGAMRNAYELPDRPGVLIKTIRPERVKANGYFSDRSRIKEIRPYGAYSVFVSELVEYVIQNRRQYNNPTATNMVAKILGIAQTTEGLALVVERITHDGEELAPTLHTLIESGQFGPKHDAAWSRFKEEAKQNHLVLGDVNHHNLVYTETRSGRPEIVCVDGFGENAFIPVHRYSKLLNARRLSRLFKRMEARTADIQTTSTAKSP